VERFTLLARLLLLHSVSRFFEREFSHGSLRGQARHPYAVDSTYDCPFRFTGSIDKGDVQPREVAVVGRGPEEGGRRPGQSQQLGGYGNKKRRKPKPGACRPQSRQRTTELSFRRNMTMKQHTRISFVAALSLALLLLFCGSAVAQTQIQGVIDGRSGVTMTVKTADGTNVVVLLTSTTQVEEVEGGLKMRKKEMGMTALIPGLPVEVKGSTNAQNQLAAASVKFKGSDLKTAQDMQASMALIKAQEAAQQAQLAQEQANLKRQQAALTAEQQQAADEAKITANKAAAAKANERFSELGEYNTLGEVDILFANGKALVGYASAVGSSAMNEKLSTERANNVTEFLEPKGGIPLTNMLAPGAMGTSKQVAPDTTKEGQAENRRVVVKILQNKGIAGT
jgi:OmpA-OmpF porin, OOP family